METMKAGDLMVPVAEFDTISAGTTFYEALQALEKARQKNLKGEKKGKILLVTDENDKIIGKLSPIDLIRGLEPNYNQLDDKDTSFRYGFGYAKDAMEETYRLWQTPFKDLCKKAVDVHIRDVVRRFPEQQTVDSGDRLDKVFHRFVMGRHDSLFVSQDGEIAGMLLFSDIFDRVSETMKACGIEAGK